MALSGYSERYALHQFFIFRRFLIFKNTTSCESASVSIKKVLHAGTNIKNRKQEVEIIEIKMLDDYIL